MDRIWLLILLAVLAGAVVPVQAGMNAQLRAIAGHPAWAALVSFTVGTLALLAYYTAARLPWPSPTSLALAPRWSWVGGLLGAFSVFSAIVVAPRLGAAVLIGLIIAGQLVASLALDHFGLVGFARHPINLTRVAGALCLLAGVVLIQRN